MKYAIVIFILAGFGLYLNQAYARIYSLIGTNNLANPTIHQTLILPPPSPTSSTKKITYVALGDSLTAGVGATAEDKTYPYRLAKLLADQQNAEVTVVNLGQPGATAADVLETQLPLVAAFHPDFVTIAVGVNDMHNRVSTGLFQQTIAAIVDNLASSTKHINIITIPYLGSESAFLPPYRSYFDWQTKRYNTLLHSALAGRQVTIIDLYSLTHKKALTDPRYFSPDGFHPSDDGFYFWSTLIYDHLDH